MNIIAVSCLYQNKLGIGYNNKLPCYNKEELQLFKETTKGSTLIVGRVTFEGLPLLEDRRIYCVSKTTPEKIVTKNGFWLFSSVEEALEYHKKYGINRKLFIAGGEKIYDYVLQNFQDVKIYLSILNEEYPCDKFFNINRKEWTIEKEEKFETFTRYILNKNVSEEIQYLNLLEDVLLEKERKTRNSITKSTFGKQIKFNLQNGFPLLTTKKMFFSGIVEELLFFLRGDTDTKILEEKGIKIWSGNTSREFLDSIGMRDRKVGLMGPMYGFQWRFFGCEYDEKTGRPTDFNGRIDQFDQLEYVINLIKNDPNSRRIIMTDYNPNQATQGVLFPCHSLINQFYCDDEYLDMSCYNRSQDLFLGVPFNISSSALLLVIIAKLCNKKPRNLIMNLGDVHIYQDHYESCKLQINRFTYKFPTLELVGDFSLEKLDKLNIENFILHNYNCQPSIKAKMIP